MAYPRERVPLVVDLDGTLIFTDTLHEQSLALARDNPLRAALLPVWLARGKAHLKERLAQSAPLNAATLPYNAALLDWLGQEKAAGRTLVLCTAADRAVAEAIAAHVGLFDQVIASDGATNLAGASKARRLVGLFGEQGFDYAGNSSADLAVWPHAREAIAVNTPPAVLRRAQAVRPVTRTLPAPRAGMLDYLKMLRVHQWLKNLLLFVPLLAAHRLDADGWLAALVAAVAFSLCASAVYIGNDLLDLESDRLHPRKRLRPFASAHLPVWLGVMLAPALLTLSLALGATVRPPFVLALLAYFALTCLYSLWLKRLVMLDCVVLAMLYTLRIVAGGAAVAEPLSHWLLAFSCFLFLSLAFVKRYAELQVQHAQGRDKAHGRGYYTSDAPLVQALGVAAGYATALVLALYLHSDNVLRLYRSPEAVWVALPVLLFWISWIWLRAHRGQMHDDPVVFAIKDRVSLAAGAVFAAALFTGTVGLPWV